MGRLAGWEERDLEAQHRNAQLTLQRYRTLLAQAVWVHVGQLRGHPGGGVPAEPELPPPPAAAEFIAYRTHLSPVRALVDRCAQAAGLPADRRADLVLAVSELAANTLTHTPGGGTAHIWTSGHEIICQVHDGGWITDPMAGRKRPPPDSHGQGLWVVNHICDLVETRSGPAGTTTRMHFLLPGP